jgi:hypothetical protein
MVMLLIKSELSLNDNDAKRHAPGVPVQSVAPGSHWGRWHPPAVSAPRHPPQS